MSNNSYHYRFDINPNGEKTSVPKPWPAKFMYYLECVFAIIQIDVPAKYTDYQNYHLLSEKEEQTVMDLFQMFKIQFMKENSLIIEVEDKDLIPDDSLNQFFDITDSRLNVKVKPKIVIAGEERKILKVMVCRTEWLFRNVMFPVLASEEELKKKIKEIEEDLKKYPAPKSNRSCCLIIIILCIIAIIVFIALLIIFL